MGYLVWIVFLATSIWVLVDAKTIGVKKGQIKGLGNLGPWGWFFACLLIWIVSFPFYLAKRPAFKRINGKPPSDPVKDDTQPASVAPIKPKKINKDLRINLLSLLFLAGLLGFGHYLTRPEPERHEPQYAYTPVMKVQLLDKRNKDGVNGQQFMEFDVSYANLCGKDIAGVSGLLLVNDSNDKTLLPLQVEFNEGIPALKTVVRQGYSTPRMQGLAESQKLWDTNYAHLHSSFIVSEVRFSDGSRMAARRN